jgi:outer membrane protein TolC
MSFLDCGAWRRAGLMALLLWQMPAVADPALTLAEAEEVALARDGGLDQLRARRDALGDAAIAEAELPDPQLRFGAMNVPTDSFDLDQEPMTQVQVGLRQRFQPGKTRSIARERGEVLATVQEARSQDRERGVRQAVRRAWIEHAWTSGAVGLLAEQQIWFAQLDDAAMAAYASGRRPQHELLRIAMERELLEERQVELRQMALTSRAALSRWLGSDGVPAAITELPTLPDPGPPAVGVERVAAHPAVVAARREADASALQVDLARQRYRPGWAVDVAYGFRDGEDADGDDRADFLSAMLSFDVPLFTGNRQDRRVSSAAAEERGRRARLTEVQRELLASYEAATARWESLADRIEVFEMRVVPSAEANVVATRQAYRNDVVPFDELVSAEKALLRARTRLLRLRTDRLLAQSDMLYLAGERP